MKRSEVTLGGTCYTKVGSARVLVTVLAEVYPGKYQVAPFGPANPKPLPTLRSAAKLHEKSHGWE